MLPGLIREDAMGTSGLRKCCHCGVWFRPHPRNAYHQRFCTKGGCRAASKRASQKKWHRKNPGYFRGEQYVKKTQAWRREHPGYWRKRPEESAGEQDDALQDLLTEQVVDNELVNAVRDRIEPEISRPLQDLLKTQQLTLVGLASMITGDALQEDIAQVLSSCYERGQRIGGVVPWMNEQEVSYEGARADIAASAPTHSAAFQLGRSPPGA
jgi:hypothetical protein